MGQRQRDLLQMDWQPGLAKTLQETWPAALTVLSQHPVKLACMHSHPHQVSKCPSTTPVVAIPVLIKAICWTVQGQSAHWRDAALAVWMGRAKRAGDQLIRI